MDDVLQDEIFSEHQKKALRTNSLYGHFLETDKVLADFGVPCTLAVLSEGIDKSPLWVKHIKRNQNRYKIELHGSYHYNFSHLTRDRGFEELSGAIKKIEDTFKTKITTWYVPIGRKAIPDWGDEVCQKLGIKMDLPPGKRLPRYWLAHQNLNYEYVNFHYWDPNQVQEIKKILSILYAREEI